MRLILLPRYGVPEEPLMAPAGVRRAAGGGRAPGRGPLRSRAVAWPPVPALLRPPPLPPGRLVAAARGACAGTERTKEGRAAGALRGARGRRSRRSHIRGLAPPRTAPSRSPPIGSPRPPSFKYGRAASWGAGPRAAPAQQGVAGRGRVSPALRPSAAGSRRVPG